jgi:hypothetical protein
MYTQTSPKLIITMALPRQLLVRQYCSCTRLGSRCACPHVVHSHNTTLSSCFYIYSRNSDLLQSKVACVASRLSWTCRTLRCGSKIGFRQHGQSLSLMHHLHSWQHDHGCKAFSMECLSRKTHFPDAAAKLRRGAIGEEG